MGRERCLVIPINGHVGRTSVDIRHDLFPDFSPCDGGGAISILISTLTRIKKYSDILRQIKTVTSDSNFPSSYSKEIIRSIQRRLSHTV